MGDSPNFGYTWRFATHLLITCTSYVLHVPATWYRININHLFDQFALPLALWCNLKCWVAIMVAYTQTVWKPGELNFCHQLFRHITVFCCLPIKAKQIWKSLSVSFFKLCLPVHAPWSHDEREVGDHMHWLDEYRQHFTSTYTSQL